MNVHLDNPTPREVALAIIERELGTPYRWGGFSPSQGFDCSGLMIEGLKSAGILPRGRGKDWTAAQLLSLFNLKHKCILTNKAEDVKAGFLLFWKTGSGKVRHVEMVWRVLSNNVVLTIGASGGGSRTTNAEVALKQDARVKIRVPYKTWIGLDPFKGE